MKKSNLLDHLKERGFIEAATNEELKAHLEKPRKIYCGFDPTSDSLHLGNMVAIMGLAWCQRFGHTPVVIVGGATGMVGDPSGKSRERNLLDPETIEKNLQGIKENFRHILDFEAPNAPLILNNYDWFKNFGFVEFLRDVGKHFRIGPMLGKEAVRSRLNSEEGMSFTEFSYQLLQGYDFLHLYRECGVTVQIGGSDQWGNITAGNELIRKLEGGDSYGTTFPLLVKSDGKKFGKSEEGAIWLSREKSSPYALYQYLYGIADADVLRLMRMFTFMEMEEIRQYEEQMGGPDYAPNSAQRRLAEEVTCIVHGKEGLEEALRATRGIAPGSETELDAEALEAIVPLVPNKTLPEEEVVGVKVLELLVAVGLQSSRGAARKLIRNGGVSLNNVRIADTEQTVEEGDLIQNRMLLLAVGKKNKVLIRVE